MKYKLYFIISLLGIVGGVYVVRDMSNNWLELGEIFRYMFIRIPLAFLIALPGVALRKKYLKDSSVEKNKPLDSILWRVFFLVEMIVIVLLLLPPNVYFWFI